jgi:hypothetical protein
VTRPRKELRLKSPGKRARLKSPFIGIEPPRSKFVEILEERRGEPLSKFTRSRLDEQAVAREEAHRASLPERAIGNDRGAFRPALMAARDLESATAWLRDAIATDRLEPDELQEVAEAFAECQALLHQARDKTTKRSPRADATAEGVTQRREPSHERYTD